MLRGLRDDYDRAHGINERQLMMNGLVRKERNLVRMDSMRMRNIKDDRKRKPTKKDVRNNG